MGKVFICWSMLLDCPIWYLDGKNTQQLGNMDYELLKEVAGEELILEMVKNRRLDYTIFKE